MNPLTRQDVLAHQAIVPWPSQRQVEQDLLLCRAMAAVFSDGFLRGQVAMRGGTLLHKVYLAPAALFSEDIDLVVVGDRPEDQESADVSRREFGAILESHLADAGFRSDTANLLRQGIVYDPAVAGSRVRSVLLDRLPE